MTTNFYESLNELVTDSRFRSLAVTQNFEGFLGTQGINEAENMHTFSWLLAPKGSHGLQDIFVKEFFTTCWTMIHGQYGANYRQFQGTKFYTSLSPLMFQNHSFTNTFVDREVAKEHKGSDIVITDFDSKTMVVINNRFNKTDCEKAFAHYNSETYKYFENKLFVTFDSEIQSVKDINWMYVNNEWIINLCTSIIECPQYNNLKISGQLKDFYQFLTGTQYGVSHQHMANHTASLISDYYEVFTSFKEFKAEKTPGVILTDINPREYAGKYYGKISDKEYEVLSLYWAYKNTFTTFFHLVELEATTRNLDKVVETKPFAFERTFVRNGLRFTPSFDKIKNNKDYVNSIFDVEMLWDMNKGLNLNLVVNKGSWDRLTNIQRDSIQKVFGFSTFLLQDRVVIWNSFYKQDWKNKDHCKEIVSVFEKIDNCFGNLGIRAA